MSAFEDINTIRLLQDLLKLPDNESSESEDEHLPRCGNGGTHSFGPGDINKPTTTTTTNQAAASVSLALPTVEPKTATTTIDEWQAEQEQTDADALETRPCPEFQIAYGQRVNTEDVFLQMGNKTAATASCDHMIITIELPNASVGIERMQLDVRCDRIDLQTPEYRLRMSLPHPIDPDAGTARYDAERKRMTLRLKMVREFDFVNF